MGSIFSTTRRATFSPGRTVHCSYEKALSLISNPLTLINSNPLVIQREQSPTDPSIWNLCDQISILGIKYKINYTAKVIKHEDGVLFEVDAPLGIVIQSHWTVTKVDGGVTYKEEVEVKVCALCLLRSTCTYVFIIQANVLLMPKTFGDLTKAHTQIQTQLASELEADTTAPPTNGAQEDATAAPPTTEPQPVST